MMKFKNFALLSALTLGSFCLSSCSESKPEEGALGVVDVQENRGGPKVKLDPSKDVFTLNEKHISPESEAFVKTISKEKTKENDADSSKFLTDLTIHIENTPIEDDLFVFGLESPKEKTLQMSIFDDKGYVMNSNHDIELNSGLSFKAIKVGKLQNGTYYLRLKDETGRSLQRTIIINHKK